MAKKRPTPPRKAQRVQRPAVRRSAARATLAVRGAASTVAKPVLPPAKGAPLEQPPIGVTPKYGALAPYPLIDRYPIVIGQNLTLTYIASVFRLATTGYRQQYVDLLDELLEQDPHLYSVVQKRVLNVANARLEIVPAELPEDDKRVDRATELAAWVGGELARIPELVQQLSGLLWGGVYYGVGACEIHWTRDANAWRADRLSFVHSRRLAYPDAQAWDLYVWDQGQVYGWSSPWGSSPTNNNIFGLRVADYPGKFVVHAPQLRGDYPTRDGVGRQTATFAALKRIAGRGASTYLERFANPWVDGAYSTQADGKPREATDTEINDAKAAIQAQTGPPSSYLHPDTIKLEAKAADAGRPKVTYTEWLGACNAELSKAVLGGTLGTEVGKGGGNRALGEVQERSELDLLGYDAKCLADTLDRDLIQWLVRLNFPDEMDLCPHAMIHVAKDPDPATLLKNVYAATQCGVPVDADWVGQEAGLHLVDKDDEDGPARRTFLSDVVDPTIVDPDLMSEEAKQQAADETANNLEIAKTKAANPPVVPGQPGQPPPATNGAPPKNQGAKPPTETAPTDKSAPTPSEKAAMRWQQRGEAGPPAGPFRADGTRGT
jgi:phage gp29-like protein